MMSTALPFINKRYRLQAPLGVGSMGSVYRAIDRLTGETVALKRMRALTDHAETVTSVLRLALANEFQMLASLRHPHIISVLDYGFDHQQQPYFTMEFVETAQTILQAGQGQPLETQVDLLLQLLQALAYLHRRDVLHRDLRPDNVLVGQCNGADQVRVSDFGLSVVQTASSATTGTSGTLAYMAPEILNDSPASAASDLYAVGIIAYELIVGRHPFDVSNLQFLMFDILSTPPDVAVIGNEQVAAVLERLLAKAPDARFPDAGTVIAKLSNAIGQPPPEESIAIREGFLQTAKLVEREDELAQLTGALNRAFAGEGGVWLVAGESGVGKSRLLDELRIRALVEGALVLRGEGGGFKGQPYELWRDVMRRLALMIDLSDLEAAILKEIVPDIGALLERPVPAAPRLGSKASQQRLALTITDIFRRIATEGSRPIVLLLEDLQWAVESLKPLQQLIRMSSDIPLLIVGNYRDADRPDLLEELSSDVSINEIKLERLSVQGVAELSASMLGEVGKNPDVVALLQDETEGNIYFLLETVRALAEEMGGLSDIGRTTLPDKVFAGGVQQIVRRRLDQVPVRYRPLLNAAAIFGRQLNLEVLACLAEMQAPPRIVLSDWLATCANVAVIVVQEGRWRFVHDKLREGVLMSLTSEARARLHHQVAEAIEAVYPGDEIYALALTEHWRRAGDAEKEAHYAQIAGKQAMAVSSFRDAQALFEQALARRPGDTTERMKLLRFLGSALENLGSYTSAADFYRQSLEIARWLEDRAGEASALDGLGKAAWLQGDYPEARDYHERSLVINRQIEDQDGISNNLNNLGNVAYRQGDYQAAKTYYEQSATLRRELGKQNALAASFNNLGIISSAQGDYEAALDYHRRSSAIAREIGSRHDLARNLNNMGEVASAQADHALAQDYYAQSLGIFREIGNQQGITVTLLNLGLALYEQDDLATAKTYIQESLETAHEIGNRFVIAYNLNALGDIVSGQSDHELARDYYEHSLAVRREIGDRHGIAQTLCGLAFVELAQGQPEAAHRHLQDVLDMASAVPDETLLGVLAAFARLYWMQDRPIDSAELVELVAQHPNTSQQLKRLHLAPLRAELEAALEPDVLSKALARGLAMSLREVVQALSLD